MQRNAGLDRDRGNAQGLSNEKRHKRLRAGQGTELCLGLKEEELRALSGGRCPERLWGHPGCPQPPAPSHPDLMSSLSIHQALAPTLVFFLALLTIQPRLQHHDQTETDAAKRIEECEEYLHHEMTWLLQVVEGKRGTMEAPLFSAVQQQWLF